MAEPIPYARPTGEDPKGQRPPGFDCPTCGRRLAPNATACPGCGRRFTSYVTKVLAVFFALVGALIVIGLIIAGIDSR